MISEQDLIFIADDNTFYLRMLRLHLEYKKFNNIKTFLTAEDCISNLHLKPKLIILDFYYSDAKLMTGMEAYSIIKNDHPDAKVIILSSQEDGSIVLDLMKMGLRNYIIKDGNLLEELNQALEELQGT